MAKGNEMTKQQNTTHDMTLASNARSALRTLFKQFRRSEEGSIIIFSLVIFVLMLMIGGMAVDLMRFETTRAKLQGTLDRAVLAAADLDQTLDPESVVLDYFAKAQMSGFLNGTTIDEGLNYRVVTADASVAMPLIFSDLSKVFYEPFSPGYNTVWTVAGSSTAEERVSDVEISLVVDVSSSMLSNSRLTNLRVAAKEFIETTLEANIDSELGLTSISIVPYSAVVNMGEDIAGYMNLSDEHDKSYCGLFEDSEFSDTDIDQGAARNRVSDFDYGAATNYYIHPVPRPWCFFPTENAILVHSFNESDLDDSIDDLVGFGNTAIDLGVKWGVGLLDPDFQNIVSGMIGSGELAVDVAGRPYGWNEVDALKVMVVMSDGANTIEYDLEDEYKTELSSIWIYKDYSSQPYGDASKSRFSIFISDGGTPTDHTDDTFYWLSQGGCCNAIHSYPQGYNNYANDMPSVVVSSPGQGIDYTSRVRHLSWQEVFSTWVRTKIYSHFFNQPYNSGFMTYSEKVATYYSLETVVDGNTADGRLSDICAAARDREIVIYTVAFEAPTAGRNALADCASSPSHYFDVSGTDISTAFAAIATDIRQLKLTQ